MIRAEVRTRALRLALVASALLAVARPTSAQRVARAPLDSARLAADSLRERSPTVAGLLGLLPGVGHLYAGETTRGWLLMAVYTTGYAVVHGGRTDRVGKVGGVLAVGAFLTSLIDAPRAARARNGRVRRARALTGTS